MDGGPGPGRGGWRAAEAGAGLGHHVGTEAEAGRRASFAVSARGWLKAPSRFLVDGISVCNKWGFALRPRSVWFYQRL